ncbi:DUF4352 domain-containing protein [Aeribacillus pallidus]|uniref:DUF4352 domain-containing protein n=1 Tax=Aeribacillus pallidus TaxID=33936 RepID=UPI003D1D46D6
MKKALFTFIFAALSLSLAGCGEETSTTDGANEATSEVSVSKGTVLSADEFEKMFSDPKKYKGSKVDFYGRIFVEPERDSDGTYLQVFANNNSERNAIIMIEDPNVDVAMDDIIHVTGTVKDAFEGENAFGGVITAPMILADSIEKTDYQTAFAPAKQTIELNAEQNQHGYKLTVQKVELADQETRVYVQVANETNNKIYFYTFDAKLIANGKQLEEEMNYDANYPEVQSELLPGVTTDGIIVFPALEEGVSTFQLYFEGSSDNWEIDFEPFVFDVGM